MSNRKAFVDYSHYDDAALGSLAQTVHDRFVANPTVLTNPPIALATFQTQIDDYMAKLQAKTSGAVSDINAFEAARDQMLNALKMFANTVNSLALGNGAIIDLSGLPSFDTTRIPDITPPAAPQDLRLFHGELSGVIIVRFKAERSPSSNEVQINLGDPNNEAGWVQKALIRGGKVEIDGFPPGIVVWVRVRTMGLKGVMGVWSDPAQIRTL